jgi:hypothetical protein
MKILLPLTVLLALAMVSCGNGAGSESGVRKPEAATGFTAAEFTDLAIEGAPKFLPNFCAALATYGNTTYGHEQYAEGFEEGLRGEFPGLRLRDGTPLPPTRALFDEAESRCTPSLARERERTERRAARRERAERRAERQQRADELAAQAPAPAGIVVPNVVGVDHQLAQDTMQSAGLYLLDEEDCTGQGRLLLWDRNWVVVSQDPPAGSSVSDDTTITLCAKKDGE